MGENPTFWLSILGTLGGLSAMALGYLVFVFTARSVQASPRLVILAVTLIAVCIGSAGAIVSRML